MTEEIAPKGEWQNLSVQGDEVFLEAMEVEGEDADKFSPDLIQDSQQYYTDEQRQNLYQKILAMSAPEKFRLAILANREVRGLLIHDPKRAISMAVLRNQRLNESEVLQYAQRKDLSEEVISSIARDQKWKKNYPIKMAVATNPKTPIPVAINLLPHLQERDLKAIYRDKNVSSVLRRRAHEFLQSRNTR